MQPGSALSEPALSMALILLLLLISRKSRFLHPMWMYPGRTWSHSEGDNKSFLKVREKSHKRP
jgi:hypothetical protein